MQYTRRRLVTTLACCAGLPLAVRAHPISASDGIMVPTTEQLRALVADPGGARVIGRCYRQQFPLERQARVLTELIGTALTQAGSGPPVAGPDNWLSRLDARVRTEFGAGDIVRINGWVLARTEARLCALCE